MNDWNFFCDKLAGDPLDPDITRATIPSGASPDIKLDNNMDNMVGQLEEIILFNLFAGSSQNDILTNDTK